MFDAYVKNPSQLTEYTIETAFVEETADLNAQYERFVHRTYTQLPDDIRPDLQAIVSGIDGADASDTKTAARAIAKYVSKSKTYSLDTPRAPEGEDFALWFLRESDTGYCVHFTTATVLLLRAAAEHSLARCCLLARRTVSGLVGKDHRAELHRLCCIVCKKQL